MELTNEFDVEVPVEQAWAVLTDLERIAPCMPGAQLTEIEGDEYRGIVKVKVGPITAQYKGVARFAEKDDAAYWAVIDAQGRDTRGQGNANATITAALEPQGAGTRVTVVTDIKLTGKVAQFGRGAIQDVSGALMGQFVSCLENDLLSGTAEAAPVVVEVEAEPVVTAEAEVEPEPVVATQAEAEAEPAVEPVVVAEPAPAVPAGVRKIDSPEAEPVDLLQVAGGTIAKYADPGGRGLGGPDRPLGAAALMSDVVAALLGRAPQGAYEVVVRDAAGGPVVIRNAPLLDDGTPMPTRYWLVGEAERVAVGRLEAAQGVRRAEAEVDPDELAAAHAHYAEERDAALPLDHTGARPFGGVGGTRRGVKCLHAHYAWYLAGGDDPVGRWVAEHLDDG